VGVFGGGGHGTGGGFGLRDLCRLVLYPVSTCCAVSSRGLVMWSEERRGKLVVSRNFSSFNTLAKTGKLIMCNTTQEQVSSGSGRLRKRMKDWGRSYKGIYWGVKDLNRKDTAAKNFLPVL